MSYYFLQILDPDDDFTRSTHGNNLLWIDLKEIAQDRTEHEIIWTSTFEYDTVTGYIFADDEEKKCAFAEISFHK